MLTNIQKLIVFTFVLLFTQPTRILATPTCEAGYILSDGDVCTICPAGTKEGYKWGTTILECTPCLHGSNSTAGSTTCPICQDGFTETSVPDFMYYPCNMCDTGRWNDYSSPDPLLEWQCTKCPPNSHGDRFLAESPADCECVPGYTVASGSIDCIPCAPGTFKTVFGSSACITCPVTPNWEDYTRTTAECQCTSLDPTECDACPVNSWRKDIDWKVSPPYVCTCAHGFGGLNGFPPCKACDVGMMTNLYDNRLRVVDMPNECQCSPGYEGPLHGPCTPCPVNTYKVDWGPGQCITCPMSTTTQGKIGAHSVEACSCASGFRDVPQEVTCGGYDCTCTRKGMTDGVLEYESHRTSPNCWWIINSNATINATAKVSITGRNIGDNIGAFLGGPRTQHFELGQSASKIDLLTVQQCTNAECSAEGLTDLILVTGTEHVGEVYTSETPYMRVLLQHKQSRAIRFRAVTSGLSCLVSPPRIMTVAEKRLVTNMESCPCVP